RINGLEENYIRTLIKKDEKTIYGIQSVNESLVLLETSKDSLIQRAIDNIKDEYETIVTGDNIILIDEYTKNIIRAAGTRVKKHEFEKAHRLFADALNELSPASEYYNILLKEYL